MLAAVLSLVLKYGLPHQIPPILAITVPCTLLLGTTMALSFRFAKARGRAVPVVAALGALTAEQVGTMVSIPLAGFHWSVGIGGLNKLAFAIEHGPAADAHMNWVWWLPAPVMAGVLAAYFTWPGSGEALTSPGWAPGPADPRQPAAPPRASDPGTHELLLVPGGRVERLPTSRHGMELMQEISHLLGSENVAMTRLGTELTVWHVTATAGGEPNQAANRLLAEHGLGPVTGTAVVAGPMIGTSVFPLKANDAAQVALRLQR